MHCLEGDQATELADGLAPRPDEYLIRKRRYSAFFATELELVLKSYGARTLVLVGALTDVCVHYTFADAHQHDYHCRVVTDCVGGSSLRRARRRADGDGLPAARLPRQQRRGARTRSRAAGERDRRWCRRHERR